MAAVQPTLQNSAVKSVAIEHQAKELMDLIQLKESTSAEVIELLELKQQLTNEVMLARETLVGLKSSTDVARA